MSGPKISVAEMKRLHLFEEDRRRLLQDLVRLKDVLKRRNKDIAHLQNMLLPFQDLEQVKESSDKLGRIQACITDSLSRIDAALLDGTNIAMNEVFKSVSVLHEADEDTVEAVENQVYECREHWMEDKMKAFKKLQSAEGSNPVREGTSGTGNNNGSVAFDLSSVISTEEVRIEMQRIEALYYDLLERSHSYPEFEKEAEGIEEQLQEIKEDTKSDSFSLFLRLHDLDVKRIRPFRNRIERCETEADLLDERLSAELARYHVLCSAAGEEPKRFLFAESSIAEIRYECARLLSEHDEKAEIREIMRHVRESLEQNGYVYLGMKEEELDFYREIYRVHDDVVLHVIYDSTGKVTMEVAVQDNKERALQPREVEQIVKEQGKFCADYEKIFHTINQSGLAMRDVARYPVSPDFAQIIDTSGFEKEECRINKADSYYEYYANREMKYLHS